MTSVFGASGLIGVAVGVVLLTTGAQAWLLWRMHRTLSMLQPLEERVSRLSYSLGLLVDTTQGCFDALASQVARRDDPVGVPAPVTAPTAAAVTAGPPTASRQQRQRRVVGAARRGQSVAQIAAQEAVAEGEVALRVQMARDLQASGELT